MTSCVTSGSESVSNRNCKAEHDWSECDSNPCQDSGWQLCLCGNVNDSEFAVTRRLGVRVSLSLRVGLRDSDRWRASDYDSESDCSTCKVESSGVIHRRAGPGLQWVKAEFDTEFKLLRHGPVVSAAAALAPGPCGRSLY